MNDWFPIRDKARPRRNRIKHRPSCYERVVPRMTKINRVICFPRSRISRLAGCRQLVNARRSSRKRAKRVGCCRAREGGRAAGYESLEVEEWQRVNFSARRLIFGWLAFTLRFLRFVSDHVSIAVRVTCLKNRQIRDVCRCWLFLKMRN